MHSFLLLASLFKRTSEPYEFAFAAILFAFHQSQELVPRSSHSLSWPPFWINFHSPWTTRSRDFCCVPGSSLLPPPYWKARRPWGRGCPVPAFGWAPVNRDKRSDHLTTRERLPVSYLALKLRYINKTHTESGVEKSLFQFSLCLLI